MISVLSSIFWLLVLLGVMILIHELGHFWAARTFDVKVDIFSFGFGPRLFGFKRGDTDYRFSAIPFGGYVKMAGDQPNDDSAGDPRGFMLKPRWQRLIIAAAGPVMNILLAVGLLTGLYMVKYQHVVEPGGAIVGHVVADSPAAKAGVQPGDKIVQIEGKKDPNWEEIERDEIASAERNLSVTLERNGKLIQTTVTPVLDERMGIATSGWEESTEIVAQEISPGMPADTAGLKPGDILVSIDGQPIRSRFKLQDVIRAANGNPVTVVYLRGGQQHTVSIKPVMSSSDGKPRFMIGVSPMPKLNVVTESLSFPAALRQSIQSNTENASLIFAFLRGLVERRMSAKAVDGPIGIARLSSRAAQMGAAVFLSLMASVSLNLAIFNLLPIPILDGGVILTLLVEMLLGRDLSLNFKEGLMKVGFVFLMAVVVFVLYNDISKVFTQG
jgi:regulator of sigma E protease